ncbi:MAG: hypothetical protein JW994_00475 [Candidatus Omnitrophica bacterium]|nr:hypothetical protein [Candidatus Omnitrophota bacterium]
MSKKRVLMMYISERSGHHKASSAVENAFKQLSHDVETLSVNSFCYTNPILEKIINRTYMSLIKRRPEVWGYLYDNPNVVKKTRKLKEVIHKYNSQKTRSLLEEFKPHAIVCTQAFPCGIIADYKKSSGENVLLSGVLTDYAPHSYWIYNNVDYYFVPSEETREKLVANGIARERIKLTGIPIDPKFKKIIDKQKIIDSLNFEPDLPIVLVMGGSQGIGPIAEIAKILDNIPIVLQTIIVTGGNRKLYVFLKKRMASFNKKLAIFYYAENVDELMEISSFIVSKPGGITISEALAKSLPMFIVKPIPGHEQMNTDYLVKNKVAIKIDNLHDLGVFAAELLSNPQALKNMRDRAKSFSKPDSAFDIAKTVLERIM